MPSDEICDLLRLAREATRLLFGAEHDRVGECCSVGTERRNAETDADNGLLSRVSEGAETDD